VHRQRPAVDPRLAPAVDLSRACRAPGSGGTPAPRAARARGPAYRAGCSRRRPPRRPPAPWPGVVILDCLTRTGVASANLSQNGPRARWKRPAHATVCACPQLTPCTRAATPPGRAVTIVGDSYLLTAVAAASASIAHHRQLPVIPSSDRCRLLIEITEVARGPRPDGPLHINIRGVTQPPVAAPSPGPELPLARHGRGVRLLLIGAMIRVNIGAGRVSVFLAPPRSQLAETWPAPTFDRAQLLGGWGRRRRGSSHLAA
jgi:hypothetical protein